MTMPSEPASRPSWEEIEAEYHREVGNPLPRSIQRETQPRQRRRRTWQDRVRNLVEWAVAIGGALLVAWAIQAFFLQAFVIPSGSMEPTLVDNDRVLVNKRYGDLNRADVVVFRRPPGVELGEIDDLIKRVVAMGGDTIAARDGVVFVNDRQINEYYLDVDAFTEDFGPVEVPFGHLFVMGDNRGPAMSFDSRFFGPIPEDLVVGRAFTIIWPLSRLSSL